QPTKLSVNAASKAVATAAQDGKRLFVVPARPDSLSLEEGKGPLVTPHSTGALPPFHPHRAIGPYVALRQKTVTGPASFAVLLYPAADSGDAPVLETLTSDRKEDAVGFRVRRGTNDDLLILAPAPALRTFGPQKDACVTDGEMAYVRRASGRLVEVGLAAGRRLELGGKTLIEVGPGVLAGQVRYNGEVAEVSARGHGTIRVA